MKVIVIGGGAAGMMAAITSADNGNDVTLIEHNEKLGKKLYITGKGRCNITNASDIDVIFKNIMSNNKFMYSSLYTFTNDNTIEYFEKLGLKTKVERGNRVFPLSDKSSDVIAVLQKELKRLSVKILLNTEAEDVNFRMENDEKIFDNVAIKDLKTNKKSTLKADKLIIATGGLSYQSTGSTGDGYRFAKSLGHEVTRLSPSLVPLNIKGDECKRMMGLSLKNVKLTIKHGKKLIYDEMGEMLFTHFGISGPLVLSGGVYMKNYIEKKKIEDYNELKISIDLKPALSVEQLDARILKDFNININKDFCNSLDKLLPQKMIPVVVERSGIPADKKVSFITKQERNGLTVLLKNFCLDFNGFRDFNEAIITKGGVKTKEINPSTMESLLVKNVYFAGEVIDVDALTGGYNLQIAWSTGYIAGC
ncbi:MAG: NAD(P)/FAD-dependent oxidoreductase [Lachnospiraceae bacterium]|nr:NAD(P)/FAD-dependent oxidoreductase [Lachnospiraceae bacterium]